MADILLHLFFVVLTLVLAPIVMPHSLSWKTFFFVLLLDREFTFTLVGRMCQCLDDRVYVITFVAEREREREKERNLEVKEPEDSVPTSSLLVACASHGYDVEPMWNWITVVDLQLLDDTVGRPHHVLRPCEGT
jgi:hypothetical protein